MRRECLWGVGLATVLGLGGCGPAGRESPRSGQTNPPPIRAFAGTQAQPKLPTRKLWVGPRSIEAEVAVTPAQLATGLMFRPALGEDEAMLCVFGTPAQVAFHMQNTSIPLSVAFIDREGTILEIQDLKPFDEHPVASRTAQVQYALEVNQGWFTRHAIVPGAVLRSESGPLGDMLTPRR